MYFGFLGENKVLYFIIYQQTIKEQKNILDISSYQDCLRVTLFINLLICSHLCRICCLYNFSDWWWVLFCLPRAAFLSLDLSICIPFGSNSSGKNRIVSFYQISSIFYKTTVRCWVCIGILTCALRNRTISVKIHYRSIAILQDIIKWNRFFSRYIWKSTLVYLAFNFLCFVFWYQNKQTK